MQKNILKEIRISKIKLAIEMIELEEKIVNAIIDGANTTLIEQGKELWQHGRKLLDNKVIK